MRLTVFSLSDLDTDQYKKSINRVLNGCSLSPDPLRKTYAAVFNGSVLAIMSAKGDCIDYFNVLEVTRNRGVGSYLLKEGCNNLLKEYRQLILSPDLSAVTDFVSFAEKYGFDNGTLTRPIKLL